jgi:hypothetical protein
MGGEYDKTAKLATAREIQDVLQRNHKAGVMAETTAFFATRGTFCDERTPKSFVPKPRQERSPKESEAGLTVIV